MIERRLHEASVSWFPPTPSLAEGVRAKLPAVPDARRRLPRRTLVVAFAALALAGTAIAASALDLVPGVRIQRVERLPETPYVWPVFGEETTVDELRETLPFELVLPARFGRPDRILLDWDRDGSPVVTAIYGGHESARLLLTQWPATVVLFDKLLRFNARWEYVDVHGSAGVWIEGGDHEVFYLGGSAGEDRVGGYLTGNVLIWHRGQITYRLELGGTRDQALELAETLRPPE